MLKKLCAAVGICAFLAGAAEAKPLTDLTFVAGAINHPTTTKVFAPFAEEATAKFAGKLGITYKAANTIFKEAESYVTLENGTADFGRVRAGTFPDKVNLMGIVDVPGMAPNATVGSAVAQELMEAFPEVVAEFPKNSVPFTAWASASYQIHSVKPIKTFEELKGKTIVVWDDVLGEVAKAFGAKPLRVVSTTTAKYLESGEADAVLCPMVTVFPYKIDQFAKYHTMIDMGVTSFNILVHKPLLDSMPKDMQDWIIAQGGMKMSKALAACLEEADAKAAAGMKKQGHTFFTFTPEQRAEGVKPLEVFVTKWQEKCLAAGVDKAVVEKVLQFTRERVQHHIAAGK